MKPQDTRQGHWHTSPELWEKLKPLARQMRRQPTPAERRLWRYIRNRQVHGVKFRRQHPIERFIVDFCAEQPGLIVEVDGAVHQYTAEEDAIRQEFLKSLGYRVERVNNTDVMQNLAGVIAWLAGILSEME